jgi:hypothetical protein
MQGLAQGLAQETARIEDPHAEHSPASEALPPASESDPAAIAPTDPIPADQPMRHCIYFEDYMEVYADPATYAAYLDVHEEWFCRCAQPMVADALGQNGYAITIGRFGALDYYVEPKIGLELLPEEAGVYRIRTIPVPDYVPPGYAVDFQASMKLVPRSPSPEDRHVAPNLPEHITHVTWGLDLVVELWFPRFIRVLPQSLIQGTGDRLLGQIVRQVSRRLTRKVQLDFHQSHGLPVPKPRKRDTGHIEIRSATPPP